MQIQIPKNQIPKEVNYGEKFGDFWGCFNIDLTSNIGNIRISPRLRKTTSSDDNALMVNPIAFVRNLADTITLDQTEKYFAVCNQKIFKHEVTNLHSSAFVADALSNSPTTTLSKLYSDACNFNDNLIVTTLTTAMRLISNSWLTIDGITMTTGIPHPVCAGFTKELLIGNNYKVISVQSDFHTIDTERLILSQEFEVNWIRSSNSAYWIGCRHKYGGEGTVFMWDGYSEYVTGDYGVGAETTLSCVIKDEIPYVVNSKGILMAFNGGGFVEIDRFPIANDKIYRLNDAIVGTYSHSMNIHRNGMAIIDGNIHILLSGKVQKNASPTDYTYLENQPSGIWEYTKDTGLYHKYSICYTDSSGGGYEYGILNLTQAGALIPINKTWGGFLAGAQIYTTAGATEKGVINVSSPGDSMKKMGYFITPKLYGNQIEEMWQKIYVLYKTLSASDDFICVKYRTSVDYVANPDDSGTWVTTSSFTTADTGVASTDEIEIVEGKGAGLSSSITNLTSSSTVMIFLDKTITGATGTFTYRYANWKKLDTITSETVTQNKEIALGVNSNWIQFKILMYSSAGGNSPEIEKLFINSKSQISGG